LTGLGGLPTFAYPVTNGEVAPRAAILEQRAIGRNRFEVGKSRQLCRLHFLSRLLDQPVPKPPNGGLL
jgi:hypothetical protein